ncbi:aryl-alcohol oxidase [Coprinopsis marcescibilis]|uniref:pyranose dehydrogenase (acceptor) n=1 Tax=Coprinopsis marcescibilis TaxID=230819 RepID=A0A5C3KUY8_COPMA|nr:aryl-alcohol oxidase [Coprinopsis marcescibilis]
MKRFVTLVALAVGSNAALYQNIKDVPRVNFDFIVVGGGASGSVIANRLSENPLHQVLLIESGASHQGVLETTVPYFHPFLHNTKYDWNFTTVPQTHLNNRVLDYARGHILGGSSSINALMYTRGSAEDYDRWAEVTGEDGWSWDGLFPYMQNMESLVAPADNHDTEGQVDPSVHGHNGPLKISLPGWPLEIDDRVERTAQDLGGDFSPILDMNGGKPRGTSWLQCIVGGGERSSSASSYLTTSVLARRNLHVAVNTRVTRVIPSSPATQNRPHAFRIVEIATALNPTASRIELTARNEVILSAGAIGTPHILLHSGIGNRATLNALDIKPLVHLPSVGQNLTDHALAMVVWHVNSTTTGDRLNNPKIMAEALAEWNSTRTGPLTSIGINHAAWLRLPDHSPIWETESDPSAGKDTPHIELAFDNSAGITRFSGFFTGSLLAVASTASRGSITLRTSNPFDQPNIDPNLLSSPFDTYAILQALRKAREFFSHRNWNGYILDVAAPFTNEIIDDDEKAVAVLRDSVSHQWHISGTATMSRKGEQYGVVNPDLTVKDVVGLRVVDASIIPFIPAAHIQFASLIVGERGADLIKESYN